MTAAFDLLCRFPLEDGRRWGDAATEAQRADAAAVLDTDAQERFHFISRSRGFSKTTDLGGVALAALLSQAPAGSKSYAVAADQDQARLLLDSVEGFVQRSPALAEVIEVQQTKITVR
jgi:phage terminase large subunit-like protein